MNLAHQFRGPLGQKQPNIALKAARQNAKGQPCALQLACCNHDWTTTALCHLRMFGAAGKILSARVFFQVARRRMLHGK